MKISIPNLSLVVLIGASTGKDLLTLKGHTASVLCVAISSDGKRIVSRSGHKTIKL